MPDNTQALVIFVKAPVPGQVKTRLCPPLSAIRAANLYRTFVKDTVRMSQSLKNTDVIIAYDPHPQFPTPAWATPKPLWFRQTGRSLGARLIHTFAQTLKKYSSVVTIGSDSPDLPARRIGQAFSILKKNKVAIGPAIDGGYYLVGLSARCDELFRGIPWSADNVFSITRRLIKRHRLSHRILPKHSDIDTVEDLKRFWKRGRALILAALFSTLGPSSYASDFSHSKWDQTLKKFVHAGLVNYSALKKEPSNLNAYLNHIATLPETEYSAWSDNSKISFWINAYNALTVKTILENYPVKSIRDIPGVWDKKKSMVIGQPLTLDHIEHEVLRKQFNEPRIHMALVCAALSCPLLRSEAYGGEKLDSQLEDQARQFLGKSENFRIDREKKVVYLSSIFDWFGKDFAPGGVLTFIDNTLSADNKSALGSSATTIKYLPYNWDLNETRQQNEGRPKK